MTKEDEKVSRHNCGKAWLHFYPEGKGNSLPGHVLHHIDPSWKHNDVERYIQWNVDDLELMTKSEHNSLHHTGKHYSEETKEKIRKAKLGKQLSEEHKNNIGKASAERKWWNNGETQIFCKTCPECFVHGRLGGRHCYNNGEIEIRCKECPEGFVPGRLPKVKGGAR